MTLAAEPDSWWSVADLAAQLRPALMLNDAEMARYLNTFQKSGLIVTDADRRVHFQPDTEPLARHVDTLAQAYRERPVTLIRMIYALRDAKIRSFADAFKLRGK